VVVPSLRELRRQAGVRQPAVSPEFIVESLLLAGKLPEENHCVLCGVATDASICCRTECERARVDSGQPPWWVYLVAFLTFGWLERRGQGHSRGSPGMGKGSYFLLAPKSLRRLPSGA